MKKNRLTTTILLLTLFVLPISAQQTNIDPKAKEILQSFNDTIMKADAFKVEVNEFKDISVNGMEQDQESNEVILKQSNNRFAIIDEDMPTSTLIMNDDNLWVTSNMGNQLKYIQHDNPPENIEGLYNQLQDYEAHFGIYSNFNLMSLLLLNNPVEKISEEVKKISYEGKVDANGQENHKIKLSDDTLVMDMYFTSDQEPKLSKVMIDYDEHLAKLFENHPQVESISQVITLNFNNWNFSPDLSKDDFVFKPSNAIEKVDTFQEQQQMMSQMSGSNPLVGKQAPDISVKTLDGDQFTLSSFKGDKPVILNFWATFCPPCRAEMPDFETVFSNQDKVEFLAVNLGDSEEKIQSFLKQMDLDLPIGLDIQGQTAQPYGVTGIPQTVMINKDGIVEDVHIGLMTKAMMENAIKKLQ